MLVRGSKFDLWSWRSAKDRRKGLDDVAGGGDQGRALLQ
jgi:hypothetical protein